MNAVLINGSPRQHGNTYNMLQTLESTFNSKNIDTEIIQIGGKAIKGCNACRKCGENKDLKCVINDNLTIAIEKLLSADIIILGSPTYFADITPELKALIDRSGVVARSNNHTLSRKIGAGVITGRRSGSIHAFNSINNFFLINGMIVPGSTYWNISRSAAIGDYEKDEEGVATTKKLGENIIWLSERIV